MSEKLFRTLGKCAKSLESFNAKGYLILKNKMAATSAVSREEIL